MRRPRSGSGKSAPPEPAGGRAWQRVQQFNLARGLPTAPTPTTGAAPPGKTPVKAAKSTKAAKARSVAKRPGVAAKRSARSRLKK